MSPWRLTGAVGLILCVIVGACSADDDEGPIGPSTTAVPSSTASSPFTVGAPPPGYRLVEAGRGTEHPTWGEDCCPTDEPFTVLAPDGDARSGDVVLVSITGVEGNQGGLDQALGSYGSRPREFTVDGNRALYAPASAGAARATWAELLVVRHDDLAVHVRAPDADREQLVAIAKRVEVQAGQRTAPEIPDPPSGLEVIGSVDVDGVLGTGSGIVEAADDRLAGPTSAYVAGFVDDAGNGLLVKAIPGSSADLDAVAIEAAGLHTAGDPVITRHEVGGRLAAAGEGGDRSYPERIVWFVAENGDFITVSAIGPGALDVPALLAVAESISPTDAAGWDAVLLEASGGPTLAADPGRVELTRGEINGVEWLLQTGPQGGSRMMTFPDDLPPGVDPCLKLRGQTRVCGNLRGGSPGEWNATFRPGPDDVIPEFIVFSTRLEAVTMRVVTPERTFTVPIVPIPGSDVRGALVFVEESEGRTCDRAARPDAPSFYGVTAAGRSIHCFP